MVANPLFNNPQPVPPLALRPRDAAVALGISERLLHDWTTRHGLPCVQIGRVKLYPVEPIKKWLAARLDPQHTNEGFPRLPEPIDNERSAPTRST